jgi:hypothetical protein
MAEDPIKLFATRAERYPEPTEADIAQGVARAALATIPVFGGTITELMSVVLAPAVERRRAEWLKELADAVGRLEAKVEGFKVENLVENEAFVSATIQATLIAIGTHQQEKRDMLRNALVNIAVGKGPDEDMQHIYLQLIDEFTPSHVKILNFLWTASSRAATNNGMLPRFKDYQEILDLLEPEFRGKADLVQQVLTDLNRRGLSTLQGANLAFPQQVMTNQGIAFLRFVLAPGVAQ